MAVPRTPNARKAPSASKVTAKKATEATKATTRKSIPRADYGALSFADGTIERTRQGIPVPPFILAALEQSKKSGKALATPPLTKAQAHTFKNDLRRGADEKKFGLQTNDTDAAGGKIVVNFRATERRARATKAPAKKAPAKKAAANA